MPLDKKYLIELLQPGDIILYQGDDSMCSRVIQKYQLWKFDVEHAQYTHVSVGGRGGVIVDVAPPRVKIDNIFEKYVGRYVKVLRYREYQGDMKQGEVAFWSASNCNKNYDVWGIAAFKFPILYKLPIIKNRIEYLNFCSDNGLWSIRQVFPDAMSSLDPNRCMPAHFSAAIGEEFILKAEGEVPSE